MDFEWVEGEKSGRGNVCSNSFQVLVRMSLQTEHTCSIALHYLTTPPLPPISFVCAPFLLNPSPNIVTYNTLIEVLCRERRVSEALQLLRSLTGAGASEDPTLKPNIVTYNILVDACGKAGQAEQVEELMGVMRRQGIEPDGITLTALIHAYGRSGMVGRVRRKGGT